MNPIKVLFNRFWIPGVCVGGVGVILSLRKYWAYETDSVDLGAYTQILWGLIHRGGGLESILSVNSPLFWPLVPFFLFFPRAEMFLVLQPILLATGGVALHYLSGQYLPKRHWVTSSLPFIYWAVLAFLQPSFLDFNLALWALPLFLWGVCGLQANSHLSRCYGALVFAMALGTGISAIAAGGWIGLVWALGAGPSLSRNLTRRFGVILLLLAGLLVYFHLPALTFNGFLVGVSAILFWMLPQLVLRLERKVQFKMPPLIWMVFASTALGAWVSVIPKHFVSVSDHARWLTSDLLPCLSYDVTVAAENAFIPHFATRPWVGPLTEVKRSNEQWADCVVKDLTFHLDQTGEAGLQDSASPVVPASTFSRQNNELIDSGYHEIWSCRDLHVFEKGMAGCLKCIPQCR